MEDYIRKCHDIDPEKLQRLISPKAMTATQEEWQRWHERLNHMPEKQMRNLSLRGILPRSLSKLKSTPICPSCAFGAAKRKPWRTKGAYRHIKKSDHNCPGSLVCIDQLISSQPDLIPQTSEYIMAFRI